MKKKKDKKISVRFCPRCRSFKVRYIHGLGNIFGVIPMQQCMDCGFKAPVFPILETTESALKKKARRKK